MNTDHLAIDRASVRHTDENGYLHVGASHITKATVNPYYGREIPGWEETGLDPDKIYNGLRDPEELQKSLPTWAGLPLHIEHHIDSADDPQKLTRVGTVGTEIRWNPPYVDAPLSVWDQKAIDGIEDGSFRELSCAYRYEPDFTPGEYEGQKYDFIMRNIRGNHVALVQEGRAGSDVLVADGAISPPDHQHQTKDRTVMGKLKDWFRGARDADPETEQKEVDLAQAIIDLHRVDPNTGEVMDVDSDLDKVAGLKMAIESIKDKLSPDEMQRLVDAVQNMSVSEGTSDNAPETETATEGAQMDEELKSAMDKCGLDADNEDEAKAFQEGVAFGSKEGHEDGDIARAMDSCGLDAENPEEAKAFAEGVKYGEEKAGATDEDETAGDEDGDKPVGDKDPMEIITAILPDLTDEQREKLQAAFATIAGDEDETVEDEEPAGTEAAQDKAMKKRKPGMAKDRSPKNSKKRSFGAMDAALIKARATSDAMKLMRDLTEATRKVRPLVGDMDPLAFDSAANVYGYTLEQLGYDPARYERKAWRGMVDAILNERSRADAEMKSPFAKDSKPIPASGHFAGLARISLGE